MDVQIIYIIYKKGSTIEWVKGFVKSKKANECGVALVKQLFQLLFFFIDTTQEPNRTSDIMTLASATGPCPWNPAPSWNSQMF